jgi:hypothetical protein
MKKQDVSTEAEFFIAAMLGHLSEKKREEFVNGVYRLMKMSAEYAELRTLRQLKRMADKSLKSHLDLRK